MTLTIVIDEKAWWKLLLIPPIWPSLPGYELLIRLPVAVALAVLVSPLAGALVLAASMADLLVNWQESNRLTAQTGVRLRAREAGLVKGRLLRPGWRGLRLMQEVRASGLIGGIAATAKWSSAWNEPDVGEVHALDSEPETGGLHEAGPGPEPVPAHGPGAEPEAGEVRGPRVESEQLEPGQEPKTELLRRLVVYSGMAALLVIPVLLVQGRALAAVAVVIVFLTALLATRTAFGLLAFALEIAWMAGSPEYLALAVSLPIVLLWIVGRTMWGRWRFGRSDQAALVQAVADLPDSIARELSDRLGDAPLTTRDLLLLGKETGDVTMANWRLDPGLDPGRDAWDGPVIGPGPGATTFAAEACALATRFAERLERPVGGDLLAAAAATVPFSSAGAWNDGDYGMVAEVLGVPLPDVGLWCAAFKGDPAGRDYGYREELSELFDPEESSWLLSEINESIVKNCPREDLATLTHFGIWRLRWQISSRFGDSPSGTAE